MYRLLSGNTSKNIPILKAAEDMTRGAAVVIDYKTNTVKKATATGEVFLVDAAKNYDGINSVLTPQDKDFEVIKAGDQVLVVPVYLGEDHTTTELTSAGLVIGDSLKAVAGKFVKAASGDACVHVYGGPDSDPTGLNMYIVKRAPVHTVA